MDHWRRPACRWRDRGCPLAPARWLAKSLLLSGSIPFERAFLPLISKADREDGEEHHHRPEASGAELAEGNRPREQERHFEVENDKEDRDQIEADVELHAGVIECVESAFIGGELLRIRLLERDQERGNQERQTDHACHADKHDKWKVILQDAGHRRSLFLRFRSAADSLIGIILEA